MGCKCRTCSDLPGHTYISKAILDVNVDTETNVVVTIIIKINEDGTFSFVQSPTLQDLALTSFIQMTPSMGEWKCCGNKLIGVAFDFFADSSTLTVPNSVQEYDRITIEICPSDLTLRYRITSIIQPPVVNGTVVTPNLFKPDLTPGEIGVISNIRTVQLLKFRCIPEIVRADFARIPPLV